MLFFRTMLNSNRNSTPMFQVIGKINFRNLHASEIPVKEIQIPVKWGHIAAKLWGSEKDRPLLALHGWQDNAGTWDPLASIIAKSRSILAIDFPGHGLSSWIPPGMQYYPWELPRLILYIKDYFNWDKVSILSHSMGSIAALRFVSVFPDDADFYIAVDSLVLDDYDLHLVIDKYPKLLRNLQIVQARLDEEPPGYSLEEAAKRWHLSTRGSVALESAPYLLKRGIKPTKSDPNKYYFCRDSRLKHILFSVESKMFVEALIKRLKCPTLYFKAIDSPFASDGYSVEMRQVIEQNNKDFECHFVPGTHHVHLNNPEVIAPVIMNFLNKHNFL